jgi:hypothetical protein
LAVVLGGVEDFGGVEMDGVFDLAVVEVVGVDLVAAELAVDAPAAGGIRPFTVVVVCPDCDLGGSACNDPNDCTRELVSAAAEVLFEPR